ncbi:FMN-binding protein [Streptomyces sp. S07_1.15]|uniref:FMN-binding protein n=1 Tax=Streptomyces sp. S07_1.15 TaxID=2873925 RepID=UPI001D1439A8|nr:FMN-binding protein [Streptomyces sp. S07_1.15]MCC3655133.1 FMN-binding protein [Streptomyces sp. S07_1.15]
MRKHPIRRVVLGSAATVSGVVLLLALKMPYAPWEAERTSAAQPPAAGAPAAPGTGGAGAPSPGAPAGDPAGGGEAAAPGDGQGGGEGGAPAQDAPRTVTGDLVKTEYGPVQARITLTGGKITAADAAQAPSGNPQTESITARAVPELGKKAVQAQSAEIDTVSGATFTSEGYKKSLQSALDRAGG